MASIGSWGLVRLRGGGVGDEVFLIGRADRSSQRLIPVNAAAGQQNRVQVGTHTDQLI